MTTDIWQGAGRRLRRRGACGMRSRAGRTTGLAAVAAASVAEDLRDPQGLTRPVLRRAARWLAESRRTALRRAGTAYLRLDPPQTVAAEPADVIDATAVDVTGDQDAASWAAATSPPWTGAQRG